MTDGSLLTVPSEETDKQIAARERLRTIAAARKKATADERAAVLDALEAGVRQADIARDLERSREHIRLIAKDHPRP